LEGIRNGKGKEYYINGEIEFNGKYLYEIRWSGKGYNKNSILDF